LTKGLCARVVAKKERKIENSIFDEEKKNGKKCYHFDFSQLINCYLSTSGKTSGLYYKHVMIVNDDSSVISE
jgi:hypothetical protein